METNPSFRRMLGYTAEEIEGLCVYDFVAHPRENVDATIARTLQSRRRIVGERKYRRKDGTLLDVEVGVSVISLDGREVICTIVRDVTERKEAERRLQEAEFRYRTLVERIPATIYIQEPKTAEEDSYVVAYMSPQVEKILGHSPRRFEGDPGFWNQLVHPEDLERMVAETERTDETGEAFGMEYRMLHADGRYRWIRDEAVLVSDERGNPSYWQGVFSDVTERKRAEELLARSEGRLRQIIETEPECVKVLGANGSLLEMNPAGLAMIEADSLEQVRGRSVYRYIAPDHRDAFVALTEKVLRGGSGTLEFELVGLKGTRRWLETHAVPLRDAGGGASGLLAITRDVTQRKHAEIALRESERLYRTVIEQATENIFLDRRGDEAHRGVQPRLPGGAGLLRRGASPHDALRFRHRRPRERGPQPAADPGGRARSPSARDDTVARTARSLTWRSAAASSFATAGRPWSPSRTTSPSASRTRRR